MKGFAITIYLFAQSLVLGIFLSYLPDAWVFVVDEVLQGCPAYPIHASQDSFE
jgi:hypothetical protein